METLDAYILRKLGGLPQMADGSAPQVECLHCGYKHPFFAIVKTDQSKWLCGSCYQQTQHEYEPVTITWADVRGVRTNLLQRSDWTQLNDVPQATKNAWITIRTSLRDITVNYPTPEAAMAELRQIELTYFTTAGAN